MSQYSVKNHQHLNKNIYLKAVPLFTLHEVCRNLINFFPICVFKHLTNPPVLPLSSLVSQSYILLELLAQYNSLATRPAC